MSALLAGGRARASLLPVDGCVEHRAGTDRLPGAARLPGPPAPDDRLGADDRGDGSGRGRRTRGQSCAAAGGAPRIYAWVLVGDDGQHDPDLYTAAAVGAPGRVRVVAIRQLPRRTGADARKPQPLRERLPTVAAPGVRAPDGFGLLELLRARGLLSGAGQPGEWRASVVLSRQDGGDRHERSCRALRDPRGRRGPGRGVYRSAFGWNLNSMPDIGYTMVEHHVDR